MSNPNRFSQQDIAQKLANLLETEAWSDLLGHPSLEGVDRPDLIAAINKTVMRVLTDYCRRIISRLGEFPIRFLWFAHVGADSESTIRVEAVSDILYTTARAREREGRGNGREKE